MTIQFERTGSGTGIRDVWASQSDLLQLRNALREHGLATLVERVERVLAGDTQLVQVDERDEDALLAIWAELGGVWAAATA